MDIKVVDKREFLNSFNYNAVVEELDYYLYKESIMYNMYTRTLDRCLSLIGFFIGMLIIYKQERAVKYGELLNKIGHFIHKTRIDEIHQLFNRLNEYMSIIEPRRDGFINRLLVKPGITGCDQVNSGYDGDGAR